MPIPGEAFHPDEQIGRAQAVILVIHPLGLAGLHRKRFDDIRVYGHQFLIQTNLRIIRIIRLFIGGQHIFHVCHQAYVDLFREAPLFPLPWLKFIFFSRSWMVEAETPSTTANSISLSRSIRSVQWSCPSGTGLHAMATITASSVPPNARRRFCCTLSFSTPSTPPAR